MDKRHVLAGHHLACDPLQDCAKVFVKNPKISVMIAASTVPVSIERCVYTPSFFIKPFEEEFGLIYLIIREEASEPRYTQKKYGKLLLVKNKDVKPILVLHHFDNFFRNLYPEVIINFHEHKLEVVVNEERFSTAAYPVKGSRVVNDSDILLNYLLKERPLQGVMQNTKETDEEKKLKLISKLQTDLKNAHHTINTLQKDLNLAQNLNTSLFAKTQDLTDDLADWQNLGDQIKRILAGRGFSCSKVSKVFKLILEKRTEDQDKYQPSLKELELNL